ncbi:HD domain-containing phosphohydrolase [Oceanirhabdus seepicola]|uniref:HD domain-containing protein n=1 Tax=Oceanirhabdus seepicola TaxID=2828781 RepID=A0A9J6P672_9CLOT|nr:HD domain-containing phosphohydrolase [Oceanirhabdus seepicola]MCM1992083.1 HD domain-containing protein [Oceanirhabdus seepicola]
MFHRRKNLKGLLFFNILHFNVGLIVIAFIAMTTLSIIITHENARKSELTLMKNISDGMKKRQNELIEVAEDISITIGEGFISKDKEQIYLSKMKLNREYIKSIIIFDKDGNIKNRDYDSIGIKNNLLEGIEYTSLGENGENAFFYGDGKEIKFYYAIKDSSGMIVEYILFNIDFDHILKLDMDNYEYFLLNEELNLIYSQEMISLGEHQYKKINEAREDNNRYIYHNEFQKAYFSGYIDKLSNSNLYLVIEHNISKEILFSGWIIYIIIIVLVVVATAIILSFKIFNIIKDYLSILRTLLEEVEKGNYNFKIPEKYQMKEWKMEFDNIISMARKIDERERQLSMFNNELMEAHNSVEIMYKKLQANDIEKRNQFIEVISSMLNLIELKDKYTAGHSVAVTKYSSIIAREMNVKYGYKIDEEKLIVGSILHDIGKIGIYGDVLNKPSKLTQEEMEIIKGHPKNGADALADINDFETEYSIIKYHHEKYDGSGYPEGLKGDEIPIEARVVCVADAFDAMTSSRPYRKAMDIDLAIKELINSKEVQFDPKVVDITVTLIKMNKLKIDDDRINE